MTGTLQKFEFSHSSFGEQYTTVDGVRYVTWLNLMDPALKGLRAGAVVEFEVHPAPTVLCESPHVQSGLPSAKFSKVVKQASEET